jgi:hypothetical protein
MREREKRNGAPHYIKCRACRTARREPVPGRAAPYNALGVYPENGILKRFLDRPDQTVFNTHSLSFTAQQFFPPSFLNLTKIEELSKLNDLRFRKEAAL